MEKSFRRRLALVLMLLIAFVVVGRFLVFTSFSCDQVKGGLDKVMRLRDVNCASDCSCGHGQVLGCEFLPL